jgi:hypothetical protein
MGSYPLTLTTDPLLAVRLRFHRLFSCLFPVVLLGPSGCATTTAATAENWPQSAAHAGWLDEPGLPLT